MALLITCGSCRGFMKDSDAECPNCGTRVSHPRGLAMKLLAVAGGAVAAVTLSACYGPPALCNLPDGGTAPHATCIESPCTTLPDGGEQCTVDAGSDGGHVDAGAQDGGADAGP